MILGSRSLPYFSINISEKVSDRFPLILILVVKCECCVCICQQGVYVY